MPERDLSAETARTAVHIVGWALTVWAVCTALLALLDPLVVDIGRRLDLPDGAVVALPVIIATLQVWGHVAKQRSVLIAGDLLGGLMCWCTAAMLLYFSDRPTGADNWLFIGLLFLVHTVMLQRREQ